MSQVSRQWALDALSDLPERTSLEHIFETLEIKFKVAEARGQIRNGNGLSHEQALEHLKKWL